VRTKVRCIVTADAWPDIAGMRAPRAPTGADAGRNASTSRTTGTTYGDTR